MRSLTLKINLEMNDQEVEELMVNFREIMTDIDALNRKVERVIDLMEKMVQAESK